MKAIGIYHYMQLYFLMFPKSPRGPFLAMFMVMETGGERVKKVEGK